MTKILFTNPPGFEIGKDGELRKWVRAGSRWPHSYPAGCRQDQWVDGQYIPFPFFMAYAASYVAKHVPEAEVILRDSVALHEGYANYYAYVRVLAPEWIFIESASPSWEMDAGIIRKLAQYSPQSKIVVCGPITALKGKDILATLPVVACIKGEYEKGAVNVLRGTMGLLAHDLLTTAEMNAAPFPLFNANEVWRYHDGCPASPIMPHAQVWSSRGCPHKCIFCVWPAVMTGNDPDGEHKRSVRFYSPEYMEAFLSEIVARHRFRSIYFDDDTFNLGNKHTQAMCAVMRKIKLPWSAMCRADTSTPETWRMMRDSGCYGVKLGFESGDQHVVDHIVNKGLDLKAARETVLYLRKLGMTVHGTFTYGLPGETPEQMRATKAYIKTLPLNSLQESGTAVIEGTPLFTLGSTGHLDAYSAARMDAGFDREGDGVKKFAAIREELAQL